MQQAMEEADVTIRKEMVEKDELLVATFTDMDAKQVHHSCPASPRPTLAPTSSATILATLWKGS